MVPPASATASPRLAQRRWIQAPSLLAALPQQLALGSAQCLSGGLTVPCFTARGSHPRVMAGLVPPRQERAPRCDPSTHGHPKGDLTWRQQKPGENTSEGSSPPRDMRCLHKPERGKVRLILNLNKQGEKAMPELTLPCGSLHPCQRGCIQARLHPARGSAPGLCPAPGTAGTAPRCPKSSPAAGPPRLRGAPG